LLSLRPRGHARRRAAGGGDWRAGAVRRADLSRQRCVQRRRGNRRRDAAATEGRAVTGAPGQLILDLAHRPALGAEDFLISRSNQAAADIVDRWPDWPHHSLVVVAPAGSGKTHLANVWRLKSGAARLEAHSLGEADVEVAKGALVVEDLHVGIRDERALFD